MRSPLQLCGPIIMVLMASCVHYQHAYYQSPFHTNTSSYKTIPMHSDSARSALYASGIFSIGNSNDRWRDGMTSFIGSVYRSHTSKFVQGYYGLTGMIGNYYVKPYPTPDSFGIIYHNNLNMNDSLINSMAGSKNWSGWGINGGINFSIPFRKHEWRIIGVEGSWQQEFGEYLDFRKKLPDTAANLNDYRRNYFTLAIGSDLVFHFRKGQVGYKVAAVFSTRNLHGFDRHRYEFTRTPGYFSQTFHLSINKVTGFSQLNLGSYAMSWQLGFSYKLGR